MIEDTNEFESLAEYQEKAAQDDKFINELEELTLQNREAALNTFYRYPRVEPDIIKANPQKGIMKPEVRTINGRLTLEKIDEVSLYILCEFKFIPIWLLEQWYDIYYPKEQQQGYKTVQNWIMSGLAWCEPTSLGVYLRPTIFLLNVIYDDDEDDDYKKFIGLPFNLMNHTCSEMQIMFDIMMGNPQSEFWNVCKGIIAESNNIKLPCYHPLHVGDGDLNDKEGTIIISESRFKPNRFEPSELIYGHDLIKEELKTKPRFTSEFNDWQLFTLSCGYNERGKLETQRPDLAIPIPRIEGKPQSIAIEMELTAKDIKRYDKIMEHYKNNDIYGYVVYLHGNNNIKDLIRRAMFDVGGLGTCKLLCIPYNPPAQLLSDFSLETFTAQYGLLVSTKEKTEEIKKQNEK